MKIEGMDKVLEAMDKAISLEDAQDIVRANTAKLQKKAKEIVPVGTPASTGIPGYVGGTLKGSIGLKISDGGLTGEVEPTADYAIYVELGTRFMNAQPYMRPAFDEVGEKFIQDLKEKAK